MLNSQSYNPDVLTCLANLSSDEVFTPPKLANEILDQLPAELWSDPEARFLDPFCKSGVFLREIAKRLLAGLEEKIPDQKERINHIFKNQLYGIAITELTALLCRRSVYCSKIANGEYSVCDEFDDVAGNIRFERIEHTWENGKCIYCGASQDELGRGEEYEGHAYEFIHTEKPEEIFNMKFDVIIGNPPYQLNDGGGNGKSASPIYDKFVTAAKSMSPRYLSMIIPARWYAGGKGLDSFRESMLNDTQLRTIVDFKSATKVFSGVDIAGGICYFLWEYRSQGLTKFIDGMDPSQDYSLRKLNEYTILIRDNYAESIVKKVRESEGANFKPMSTIVSARKPFGLSSTYKPVNTGIPCLYTQKIGLRYANSRDVKDPNEVLNKWKVVIPIAPIAGQTDFSKPISIYHDNNILILKPGECCSETWIVLGATDSKTESQNLKSYALTKIFRFLLLQAVVSQNITRGNFLFVPDLGSYKEPITDNQLCQQWEINTQEWDYIASKIR